MSKSQTIRTLALFLKNQLLSVLALLSIVMVFVYPIISGIMVFTMIYGIIAQFKEIWFCHILRRIGYYCFYLQYSHEIMMDTQCGRLLVRDKEMYLLDYVHMGYTSFDKYVEEIVTLEISYHHMVAEDILANVFD